MNYIIEEGTNWEIDPEEGKKALEEINKRLQDLFEENHGIIYEGDILEILGFKTYPEHYIRGIDNSVEKDISYIKIEA